MNYFPVIKLKSLALALLCLVLSLVLSEQVKANLLIRNGATLTVSENSELDVNCTTINLRGVLNLNGGTVSNKAGFIEDGEFNNVGGTIESCLPDIRKEYLNASVFEGQQSRVFYRINNSTGSVASNVAFSDTLDSQLVPGLVVSDTPSVSNTCGGDLTALPNSPTISLANVTSASGNCFIGVNVRAVAPNVYDAQTSDLSSSLGSGNPGQAIIEVLSLTGARVPVFTSQFSPSTIRVGDVSVITYAIDNSNGPILQNINFVNQLPSGISITSNPDISTDCIPEKGVGSFTATAGGSLIEVSDYAIFAGASCTFSVNVTSASDGTLFNTTSALSTDAGSSGTSTDTLTVIAALPVVPDVSASRVLFEATFQPALVDIGQRSTLTYTIANTQAGASNVSTFSFEADLPQGLEVEDLNNASINNCGSQTPRVSAVEGTNAFSFLASGFDFNNFRALPINEICTVSLDVIANEAGNFSVVDVVLSADNVFTDVATATLEVSENSLLNIDKSFLPNTVSPGEQTVVSYTLRNNDPDTIVDNVSFSDDLTSIAPSTLFLGLIENSCGGDVTGIGSSVLALNNAIVSSSSSCQLSVMVIVPQSAEFGRFESITSLITGELSGVPIIGNRSGDLLAVSTAPLLTTEFTPAVILSGEDVVLQYTLLNPSPTSVATDISFATSLPLAITAASLLPSAGECGASSSFTFTIGNSFDGTSSMLVAEGLSLGVGESCTFNVIFDSEDTTNGVVEAVTAAPTATVDGLQQTGQATVTQFSVIGGLMLTAHFVEDTVVPGSTTTLEFTLAYSEEADDDVVDITFDYNFESLVAGAIAQISVPLDSSCGASATLALSNTNSLLTLQNAELSPGQTCEFSIEVAIPSNASNGLVENESSDVSAMVGGAAISFSAAQSELIVSSLVFSGRVTPNPVLPGEQALLEYTIENSGTSDATSIFFTSSLRNALSGLAVVAPLPTEPCGIDSLISGTTSLTFSGGSLLAGESCTFELQVQVPMGAGNGEFNITTSSLSGDFDGLNIALASVSSALAVDANRLLVNHFFDDASVVQGETVTIEYEVTNVDTTNALTDIVLTHDLASIGGGLMIPNLPLSDVCGAGSSLTESAGSILLNNGLLGVSESCVFNVTVVVPADADLGLFQSQISSVSGQTSEGLLVSAQTSQSELFIQTSSGIDFSKTFTQSAVASGGEAQLSYTINNNSTDDIDGLRFTDDLDDAVSGLVSITPSELNICGLGSQVTGTSQVVFTGGLLAAGDSCVFSVDLQLPLTGDTGELVSVASELLSNGVSVSEPAEARVVVTPQLPVLSFGVIPNTILVGGLSTLTFTIESASNATELGFNVNLPAGLEVATVINITQDCGGSLTTVAGGNAVAYSGGVLAAGATCAVSLDITATLSGEFTLETSVLNSSVGTGSGAQNSLLVLSDVDQDGVADINDNCQVMPNPDQANLDNDALGNVCDPDDDGDGLPDSYELANGLDPLDASDQLGDLDDDGFNNLQEFQFGTDPNEENGDENANNVPDIIDRLRSFLPGIIIPLLLDEGFETTGAEPN